MNNLAIILKKKRDEEARLARTSPQAVFNDDGTTQSIGVLPHTHSEYTVLSGASAPATSTVGALGQFYLETTTPALYQCTAVGATYTWTEVGGGGSYELPQATETTLGGIVAAEKTTESAEVKIDTATGRLYAPAAGEAANGVSAGGTAGQIYAKIDGTDYNAEWIDAPSGGGYENAIDEPPATPSAWDDEFDGASLDVKWSWLNQSASSVSFAENALQMDVASGANVVRGIVQAVPSGDFTAIAKLNMNAFVENYYGFGVGVYNSANSRVINAGKRHAKGVIGAWYNKSTLTAWSADATFSGYGAYGIMYIKLTRVGTVITFSCSLNGVNWLTMLSEDVSVYISAITHIGLLATRNNTNAGHSQYGVCDWFRVTEQ